MLRPSNFEALRRRALMRRPVAIAAAAAETPAVLCILDALAVDGEDIRALPQLERKTRLARLIPSIPGIQFVQSLEAHGEALFTKAVELDIEGIVAKRIDAPSLPADNSPG
jgi:ATP-dependent DNA ligase